MSGDAASHAYRGETPRTAVMFGPAGVAYVYFVFGMHWCLNIVCGAPGEAAAVLVRAGPVVAGADVVRERRGVVGLDHDLARGPARLAVGLGCGRVGRRDVVDRRVGSGDDRAAGDTGCRRRRSRPGRGSVWRRRRSVPWRFWVAGDPSVSTYRRHVPRRRR